METSFTVGTRVQDIKILLNEIGFHQDGNRKHFNIPVEFTFRMPNGSTTFDVPFVRSRLCLHQPISIISDSFSEVAFNLREKEQKATEYMSFTLTDKDILFLERYRKDDITFTMTFSGVLHILNVHLQGQVQLLDYRGVQNWKANRLQFTIPQSVWVGKVLPGLGYESFKLIEIPLKHSYIPEAYDHIISEFNKAETYYKSGDYTKCVGHCRGSLDALNRNLRKIKEGTESESSFEWLKKIDSATLVWIDELSKGNSRLASKAHHAGLETDFKKHEAESIYLVTLGLLNHIGYIKHNLS